MVLATVTSKGQVTIPKSVREALQIKAGDQIELTVESDRTVIMRPVSKRVDHVFGRLRKKVKSSLTTEEMDAAVKKRMLDRFHEGA